MVAERHAKLNRSETPIAVAFLLPTIILICLVTIVPIVYAFQTSLFNTQYAKLTDFIGLENYKTILTTWTGWQRIINSIAYVLLSLVIVIPLGVGVGTLLNRKIKCRGILRTVIILPWVLSQTVSALLWKWLLNSSFGPVVYFIYKLTGYQLDFINSPMAARFTVVLANVWNTFPIVLILTIAALQTIPKELYEAAKVDGARGSQVFRTITLPLIKPTIKTAIMMESIEYFNMVTLIYVMTAGGPFDATKTISVTAFQEGFEYWHLGLGSAYSIVIFLLNILFSIVYMKMLKTKED